MGGRSKVNARLPTQQSPYFCLMFPGAAQLRIPGQRSLQKALLSDSTRASKRVLSSCKGSRRVGGSSAFNANTWLYIDSPFVCLSRSHFVCPVSVCVCVRVCLYLHVERHRAREGEKNKSQRVVCRLCVSSATSTQSLPTSMSPLLHTRQSGSPPRKELRRSSSSSLLNPKSETARPVPAVPALSECASRNPQSLNHTAVS